MVAGGPNGAGRPVKLKDVAEAAGVSMGTASQVLNDVAGARIAEGTRRRVRTAAEALGYRANSLARGLRTQRTHTIALISDVIITTPYAGRMVQGAQDYAWAKGYVLVVVNTNGEPDLEQDAVAALLARQVDGFIYGTMRHRVVSVPEALIASHVVVLDSEVEGEAVPAIVPDDLEGGALAARTLLSKGHRRVGHVTDPMEIRAASLRLQGFRRELDAVGCFDSSLVVVGPGAETLSHPLWGKQAASDLLVRDDRPTAIFAYNDRVAVGVYRAARALGLRVPEDLSVVGFDDQELVAADLEPPLTTVALPHYEMGWAAAQAVIEDIEASGPSSTATATATHTRLIPCPLVARESVTAVPL